MATKLKTRAARALPAPVTVPDAPVLQEFYETDIDTGWNVVYAEGMSAPEHTSGALVTVQIRPYPGSETAEDLATREVVFMAEQAGVTIDLFGPGVTHDGSARLTALASDIESVYRAFGRAIEAAKRFGIMPAKPGLPWNPHTYAGTPDTE